jgi:hypothetical protein
VDHAPTNAATRGIPTKRLQAHRRGRINLARRRRAWRGDGDIHRPRWLDRALDQARPPEDMRFVIGAYHQ